jgi:protein-S-isoprenylcysteine O-methyltransferase Ste14
MPEKNKLVLSLIGRSLFGPPLVAAAFFLPAWTVHFWQAWAFLTLQSCTGIYYVAYFYRRDRQVLERRLLRKEGRTSQKFIIFLWRVVTVVSLVLSGFDYRKGWSRDLFGLVPLWLELASLGVLLAAFIFHTEVLKANRFGASIIRIEAGQTVSATGLYGLVRHPMYVGFGVMGIFTPLALGSYVGFFAGLPIIPIIVWRLLDEEKFLCRELPGYAEYCQRTPHRLIPHVW